MNLTFKVMPGSHLLLSSWTWPLKSCLVLTLAITSFTVIMNLTFKVILGSRPNYDIFLLSSCTWLLKPSLAITWAMTSFYCRHELDLQSHPWFSPELWHLFTVVMNLTFKVIPDSHLSYDIFLLSSWTWPLKPSLAITWAMTSFYCRHELDL